MIAQTQSATLLGIEAVPIIIEVDLQRGQPKFFLVGLPDKAVEESKQRVQSAIQSSGLDYYWGVIVCNLAPGDIKKEGPALDLPIAAAILASNGQIPIEQLEDTLILGELSLDGSLRPVDGALSVALMCKEKGISRLILPLANASEAAVVPGLDVYGIETLNDLVNLFKCNEAYSPVPTKKAPTNQDCSYSIDFSEIKGQRHAVRALEIAAAGGHNVLMVGPPGSGKTMLASRLATILPPLNLEESIEVTKIYSASGQKRGHEGLIWERPFRSPHHTTSYAALVGGSGKGGVRPGEISLAHHGVLFLDEMPEYGRDVLETLRQPLEGGTITVSRVHATVNFPANCILVGAMNPCPCGFKGYPEAQCVSNPTLCSRYAQKISGPLLDRIDLNVQVARLKPDELLDSKPGESSENIRQRVLHARQKQFERFGAHRINAKMAPAEIKEMLILDDQCKNFMLAAASKLNLSGRAFDRILKVARTIADLADSPDIKLIYLTEAVQYRTIEI